MARNQSGAQKTEIDSTLPDGYTSVVAERAQDFYILEAGNICEGILLGFHYKTGMDGKKVGYFQVRSLRKGTKVNHYDDDGSSDEMESTVGMMINVDEKAGLAGLASFAQSPEFNDGKWAIYIKPTEKVGLDGGKSFWKFVAGKRQISDSDIPF